MDAMDEIRDVAGRLKAMAADLPDPAAWRQAIDKIAQLSGATEATEAAMKDMEAKIMRRLEAVEIKADRPGRAVGGGPFATAEQRQHADAFAAWLRRPGSRQLKAQLAEIEIKAASGASDTGGGFLVPEILLGDLMKRATDANPLRGICRVVRVSSGDVTIPLSNANAASAWVGQAATRTATAEPTLRGSKPTFGTIYSYVEATEELVADAAFDVAGWFTEAVGDEIARAEAVAFVDADGTNKPTGLLDTAPESAADDASPSRTETAFRYIPTGDAAGFGALQTTSPAFYPADVLHAAIYDLKSDYRRNARWLMNSATAGVIRRFKDAEGRYLWLEGLTQGQPATLLGYPVEICEAVPDIGTNAHPVMFGDFERGYVIADRDGIRITVDDNITKPGSVRWYIRRRTGGIVHDNNAVRAIKCAVS